MKYDPDKHHRRSLRLKGYDYASPSAYFITICTQNRACLFGEIDNGVMQLNDAGQMVQRVWVDLPQRFPAIELNAFVIMPNHIHGIIQFTHDAIAGTGERAGTRPAPTEEQNNLVGVPLVGTPVTEPGATLGEIVGTFKSISTHEYAIAMKQRHWEPFHRRLWQRNYYEHIIRDTISFEKIEDYVQTNPQRWHLDQLHPESPSKW
ncbi:MAG: transposase [Leptolyngbyaceae cyanobacterium bins.349]|nr:transposase [Leptolyngbyaceae cyanobacterium bins.349]